MTGFTSQYLPLISDYSNAQQDLLTNSSVITDEQCIPHVAQAQYASYLQNFSRHKWYSYTHFCELGHDLYCML